MSTYLGRPAGYRPWPGRLIRAAESLAGFLARLTLTVTLGIVGGVLLGGLGCLALVLYVLTGNVEPTR